MPKLCDLGEARKLKDCRKEDLLMPIMYHAPEVIPEMSWSYPVDVWAFGLMEKGPLSSGERGSALEDEEKVKFLNLMRKIVQWLPEDQCSIEEIWDEEWFSIDLEVVKPGT
ncbi:hypothetical protein B0A48_13040 [Cryoendolithus antarcticus]|uniref:Protein kinase domain-containing protein n=1 Tax=Cryoendolithus antarcticus TaxID=1507870 RepID=A0A1V8SQM8_9PEZI|nr:hypothetical protein B0A48_13040 [Cryoendolithus antarcticus]